jgi:hypothetical protein
VDLLRVKIPAAGQLFEGPHLVAFFLTLQSHGKA